jgi:chaperonin GroES
VGKAKAKTKVKTKTQSKNQSKVKSKTKSKAAVKVKATSKSKAAVKSKASAKPKAAVKAKAATKVKTSANKAKATVKSKVLSKATASTMAKSQAQNSKNVISSLPAKFQPLGDRALVLVKSTEKRTAGGLYIPDTAAVSGNLSAQVIAVGHGFINKKGHLRPMDVKVGDLVLITDYAGEKVEINSQEYRVLHEADILGVQEGQ